MKRSLKTEIAKTLERNAYSLEDVAFAEMSTVEGETVYVAADRFLDMAVNVEYEDGTGGASIQDGIRVFLKDGSFLARVWCDGTEWFRLYEFPGMNPPLTRIGRDELAFLNSERKGVRYGA